MGRCPWGEFLIMMSIGQVVLEAICPWGELSKRVLIGRVDMERDAMGQDFMGRFVRESFDCIVCTVHVFYSTLRCLGVGRDKGTWQQNTCSLYLTQYCQLLPNEW
jgi:hypothetical protein